MRRGIVALLAAKAVSDVGTALDFICLAVFVWVRTGSALAIAAVGVVMYGGALVGGRLAHRYADRWDRRAAMIAADLARAGAMLSLAVVPGAAQLWLLYPAVLVVGAGQAVFGGTLGAATPVLAGRHTQLVNSIVSGMTGVSRIVGMGLAAVAVGLIGYRGVFALDAATYLLSAAVLLTLRLPMREGSAAPRARGPARDGWAVLVAAGAVAPLAVRGLDAFGSSSQHVGLPILGAQLDPDDPASVTGLVWMVWSVGVVATSLVLRPLLRAVLDRASGLVFYAGTVVMSLGFVGIFWLPTWPGRLAAAALAGAGDALSEVAFKQVLQRLPDDRRGSAFGLAQSVVSAGFLSGLLVSGLVVTPGLVPEWVLLLHGVPVVAAVAVLVAQRRTVRVPVKETT